MRKTLVMLFCLAFACASAQQDVTFKVLVSKGKSEVKGAGDSDWRDIKIGQGLMANEVVKVEPNGYLGLMHVSGKPYELKSPGDYVVAELSSKVGGGSSVLNKYTDFILSSEQEKRNKLAATGAVHRDPRAPIDLYLPGPGIDHVYSGDITINWEKQPDLAPYHVTFTNLFGDELFSANTDSTSLSVNLNDGVFASEETVLVMVSSKDKKNKVSNQKSIKKLAPDVRQQITQMLNEFGAAVDANTALNEYVLGGFYEDRGLIVDALSAYSRASQMAPDVPMYLMNYLQLLDRLNLKKLTAKDIK